MSLNTANIFVKKYLQSLKSIRNQWRSQDFGSGRTLLGVGLVGGPGAGASRGQENFRKFSKNF